MNRYSRMTALTVVSGVALICCATASRSGAQARPPSQRTVNRALAKGPANAGGPFDINVTGVKKATDSGNDASFCVSTMGDMKILALSLVGTKWAVSISGLADRPAVGSHVLTADMTKTLTAELTDKTTGVEPIQWMRSDPKSGTLTITKSDATKLSGSYEFVATPKTGGEWRAKGKFEANAVKC